MNNSTVIDGAVEGLLRDKSRGDLRLCRLSYASSGDGPLSREDLSMVCICGSTRLRSRMSMELALREAEAGEHHAILDLCGAYSPLIDYIPSLRLYKIGRYASINPFKRFCAGLGSDTSEGEVAKTVSAAVQAIYELSRDERIYLERSLATAYSEGLTEPTMDDVNDRLLQLQAEVQPKEAYKIECLKNVLWELDQGALGSMFRSPEKPINFPAVLDLTAIGSIKGKALLASSLLLRAATWGITAMVIEPADRILSGSQWSLLGIMGETIERLSLGGVLVHLCAASPSILPKSITDCMSALLFCGPMWEEDLLSVERGFALGPGESKALRHLSEGSALLCLPGKETPSFLRPSLSVFRGVTDGEIIEHMQALGEEQKELGVRQRRSGTLEKMFKDRTAMVYAWEVLRLIKGGRVPVDAVTCQRNVLLKTVVKTLKRYFMIVEYTDSTGMLWYRLTKVGENALSEMGAESEGTDGDGVCDGVGNLGKGAGSEGGSNGKGKGKDIVG